LNPVLVASGEWAWSQVPEAMVLVEARYSVPVTLRKLDWATKQDQALVWVQVQVPDSPRVPGPVLRLVQEPVLGPIYWKERALALSECNHPV